MPTKQCPLCQTKAEYKQEPFGKDHKLFTCTKCQLFVMSSKTEKLVISSPEKYRKQLSDKSSRVSTGSVLYIFDEEVDETTNINSRPEPEGNWS